MAALEETSTTSFLKPYLLDAYAFPKNGTKMLRGRCEEVLRNRVSRSMELGIREFAERLIAFSLLPDSA